MNRAHLLVVLLLAGLLPIPGAAPQTSSGLEWWGSTEIGQGFHFRIPVLVTNPYGHAMTEAPVAAKLDLGEALIQAGWASSQSGDRRVPQSFQLDPASVRVAAMTDLQPRAPGSTHGRLLTYDDAYGLADPRRYEIPSTWLPGLLGDATTQPFDARSNPQITVLWRVPGEVSPGQQLAFVVYFDSLVTRPAHQPSSYQGTDAGALDALYWTGPVLTAYGIVKDPPNHGPTHVTVIGTQPETRVTVHTAAWNGLYAPAASTSSAPNPFTVGAGQSHDVVVSTGANAKFKLVADKPILAMVDSVGFVPSSEGAFVGGAFRFDLNHPTSRNIDTVYFVNAGNGPTTIRVDTVPSGPSYNFHLNDTENIYAYSRGARDGDFASSGGPCAVADPEHPSPLLPNGAGSYRATVTSGGPVLLQIQPQRLTQVPSSFGAPVGTTFDAARAWTHKTNANGVPCVASNPLGVFYAAPVDAAAALTVTSAESATQLFPYQESPTAPRPPAWQVPGGVTLSGPLMSGIGDDVSRDRPLHVETGAQPVWLFSGPDPAVSHWDNSGNMYREVPTNAPAIAGPLGGTGTARRFVGAGPTLVQGLYDGTRVRAELYYHSTGAASLDFDLAAGQSQLLEDKGGFDFLERYRLTSTVPIVALPLQTNPGFLGGIPAFLEATTPLDAEYRGYLLGLRSPTGLDPVTGSTAAGTSVTYPLIVTNLGRQADGGDLPDDVTLEALASPGWDAAFDREIIQDLRSGEEQTFHLTVTPNATVPAGTQGLVQVIARSAGNPAMAARLGTATFLKQSHGVGIWFDTIGGPKTYPPVNVASGGTATYTLVVQNRGSVGDTVRLDLAAPEVGWAELLLDDDGVDVNELVMEPFENRTLQLKVHAPDVQGEGLRTTRVTATSLGSPALFDRVTATTRLRAPSDVVLELPAVSRVVDPGDQALFPVVVRNQGAGSAKIRFGVDGDGAAGWYAPDLFRPDPATGRNVTVHELTLGPHEAFDLFAAVTARPNAGAGNVTQMRVHLLVLDGAGTTDGFLQGIVRQVHELEVSMPSLPLRLDAAPANRAVTLTVANRGNFDELLFLAASNRPPGWTVDAPATVLVPRNSSQAIAVTLTAAPGARPGRYDVSLDLVSEDGTRTRVLLDAVLGDFPAIHVGNVTAAPAQPGLSVTVTLDLANDGNTPILVGVARGAREGWMLDAPNGDSTLHPPQSLRLALAFRVPGDAPDGLLDHHVLVRARSSGSLALVDEREVTVPVEVGRPNLALADVGTFPGYGGTLVRGTVRNDGDRDAHNVTVVLDANGGVLDSVSLQRLPAGANASITLLDPLPGHMPATLRIDGRGTIIERSTADNAWALEASVSPGGKAGASGSLTLAAALLAAALRQRQRRF